MALIVPWEQDQQEEEQARLRALQARQQAAKAIKEKQASGLDFGDILGGLFDIGGSIASAFPGVGTGVGAGLKGAGGLLKGL